MQPWLKAGLIGGAAVSLIMLLSLVTGFLPMEVQSYISCCTTGLCMVLYPCIGALAAYWLTPPLTIGLGAKEGALAGIVAGVISGVINFIVVLLSDIPGAIQTSLDQMPAETLEMLEQSGSMGMFTQESMMLIMACSIPVLVLWAVAFGALGGLICAAVRKE